MEPIAQEVEQVLVLLADTPRRIAILTNDIDSAQLQGRPAADSWSANELLAHLRANADIWGKSILRMIAEDHPTIRYVSPRGWMTRSGYSGQDFAANLRAFTAQRDELLGMLKDLATQDWARGATFTGTTRGREHTVLSYAQRIADHEAQHLPQLEAVIEAVQAQRQELI